MEQEDIQKIAAKLGQKEADVALALRTANDDIAEAEKLLEPTVSLIKGCYSAKTNRLNGGLVIIVLLASKRIHRVRTVATYDASFGSIPLSQTAEQIERKIVEAQMTQNCVAAISQDLAGEIEFNFKENMAEISPMLAAAATDDLSSRIRRIICTSLGDSDVDVDCDVALITPLALKIMDHEIAAAGQPAAESPPDAPPAETDDPGMAPAPLAPAPGEGRQVTMKTDVILSPVAGVSVTSLNPGDFILVKITDTSSQAAYIANLLRAKDGDKNIPVRVPIKKIERGESNRLIITTEFGAGIFGKTVVQEGLKIKVEAADAPGAVASSGMPSVQTLVLIGVGVFILLLLVFAVYYFTTSFLF